MNTSVQWTSKKLVAALIAAGVLGGMGATAVQQAPFAGHAQAQAAPPAVTATAPLPSATGVAAPDFSAITAQGYKTLQENQQVEFTVTAGPKGPQAQDVTVL